MPQPPENASGTTFEQIDWDEIDRHRAPVSAGSIAFLAGMALLVAVFLYDRYVAHVYLVGTWNVAPHDWLFLVALVVILAYGLVPALVHRHRTRRILRRLKSRPVTTASAVFLVAFVVIGLVGPAVLGMGLRFDHQYHPPLGFTARTSLVPECIGTIRDGEGILRYCHGTTSYPLGTNSRGHDMMHLAVTGMRVSVYVAVFAVGIVIPLATIVGVVAGYYGGLVDDLLMAYVDVQLSVPAIIVYFIAMMYVSPQLWLLLVVFGLLSWGGIARLVRSEVLQRREEGFVLAAEGIGASRLYVARRHLLPNVTNTVIPAAFHLVPILILTEAGLSFLGFHDNSVYSWGRTIAEGLVIPYSSIPYSFLDLWWISTIPAILLAVTVLAFKLAGDGLRDAFDPRGGP